MVQSKAARVGLTAREAKRIALRIITSEIHADLEASASPWRTHPETGVAMSGEDAAQVARAAREILAVLERRAGRLRSYFSER